jgi:hypothetical protein
MAFALPIYGVPPNPSMGSPLTHLWVAPQPIYGFTPNPSMGLGLPIYGFWIGSGMVFSRKRHNDSPE